jgi:hypothetical protein
VSIRAIFLSCGGLVFVLFAYWQFNDNEQYGNADAWAWIIIYAISALLSFIAAKTNIPQSALYTWFGFTIGALVFRLQDDTGNFDISRLNPSSLWTEDESMMIQTSNESSGLLILAIWALVLICLNRKREKSAT